MRNDNISKKEDESISMPKISMMGKPGRHIKISQILIMILSIAPPKYPDKPPKITPKSVIANTDKKLIASEILPPTISRASTSRAFLSVPIG